MRQRRRGSRPEGIAIRRRCYGQPTTFWTSRSEILDNLSAHKTTVQKWLLRHRRVHLHFTPTYGSWMNLVERWFSALTTKKLQHSAHRNVQELAADITAWADTWNENPIPFVWHKTAEQILERLAGYCAAINSDPT